MPWNVCCLQGHLEVWFFYQDTWCIQHAHFPIEGHQHAWSCLSDFPRFRGVIVEAAAKQSSFIPLVMLANSVKSIRGDLSTRGPTGGWARPRGPRVGWMVFPWFLGGGFKYFLFSPLLYLGKIPNLTNISQMVETTNQIWYFCLFVSCVMVGNTFLTLAFGESYGSCHWKVAFRFCCPIPEKRWMQCFRVAERRWQRWRKDFGGWALSSWCSYIVFVWLEFEKERHMPTIHVYYPKSVICRNTLLWYVFKCSLHESILRGVNRLYNILQRELLNNRSWAIIFASGITNSFETPSSDTFGFELDHHHSLVIFLWRFKN